MNNYEIVFQKVSELLAEDGGSAPNRLEPTAAELDELDELRRFSAELQEPETVSFTSTI